MPVCLQIQKQKLITMMPVKTRQPREGEIGKKSYKAEYSGKTGEGYILSDDNGTDR